MQYNNILINFDYTHRLQMYDLDTAWNQNVCYLVTFRWGNNGTIMTIDEERKTELALNRLGQVRY